MREIILGIAAAIVIAIGAGMWLESLRDTSAERNTAPASVRL